LTTNSDGCTIQDVSFTGDFIVSNNNTTLNNVKIDDPGDYPADDNSDIVVKSNWGGGNYTGTLIENSEIYSAQGAMYCVGGFNFTLIADNLHGCMHLINLYGQTDNVTVENSYLHGEIAMPSDHVELIYASPGAGNVSLTGDNFVISPEGGTTASVFLDGTDQDSNWNISGNWFDGSQPGASNWGSVQSDTSGITFQNNEIGLNSIYGPALTNDYPFSVTGGNVWMYSGTTPFTWSLDAGVQVVGGQTIPGLN
jgi:hypothetical protein